MKLTNKKGFTLMEMLIVVAIIAILVAIAIPTMTNALEQSRESADAANIRAAYAEVMTAELTEGAAQFQEDSHLNAAWTMKASASGTATVSTSIIATVPLTQQKADWQNKKITNIAGTSTASLSGVKSNGAVTITFDEVSGTCVIAVSGN